ncbi:hypothetical protein VcP032_01 [Vibrio phage VcP032]|uniref:Uncharacterized protein n=1 Tax=Vibrio phage VcP032 TaxID=1841196 RepID=A0A166YH76_9CAUD|nr:hypothetical protein VcP032_01 [Vibrio phage VcP032]
MIEIYESLTDFVTILMIAPENDDQLISWQSQVQQGIERI